MVPSPTNAEKSIDCIEHNHGLAESHMKKGDIVGFPDIP